MVQSKTFQLSLSALLDIVVLCVVLGCAAGIAKGQTTTCPGVLSISASLGGCDNVFVGWTHSGPLAVVSQSLQYGDGLRPVIDNSVKSYSRFGVGCSYSTAVTVTQTYSNGQTCIAYYNDNHNRPCSQCAGVTAPMSVVSAANYRTSATADSIAAAFGQGISTVTASATSKPLPLNLGGVQVWVDEVQAGLLYVSPNQVNFQIPPGIGVGLKNVRATNAAGQSFNGDIYIAVQAPAVFTRDMTGDGPIALDVGNGYISIYPTGLNTAGLSLSDVYIQTPSGRYNAQFIEMPTAAKPAQFIGCRQLNFVGVPLDGQGAELHVAGFVSQGFILRR